MPRLRITEIFHSLQGESRTVGHPTVFVRLTGCPLRCTYCDTEYAFTGGEWMEIEQIVQQVKAYGTSYVTVTGGEPLSQKDCQALLIALCDGGYEVSLETSGSLDISDVDSRVSIVMDLKTPASGEMEKNRYQNLDLLKSGDQLKFVICDEEDYQWSKEQIEVHQLAGRCELLFSPCFGALDGRVLADWILRDQLPVRFQLQLHKLLWGEEPGR